MMAGHPPREAHNVFRHEVATSVFCMDCVAQAVPAFNIGGRMSEANQGAVRELSHFIDGQRAAGVSGRFGDVFDPAQGQVAARVPFATAADVAAAVAAAKAAFPAWRETTPLKRA